jgi:hypothetical protein
MMSSRADASAARRTAARMRAVSASFQSCSTSISKYASAAGSASLKKSPD